MKIVSWNVNGFRSNIACEGTFKKNFTYDELQESNLKQFKQIEINNSNFHLNINYLPMSVNAAQNESAEAWAKSNKISFSKSVEIYRPKYLTYASLNVKLRQRYNISSEYEYDENMYKELLKQMDMIDRIKGTDFKKACPEFFEDE